MYGNTSISLRPQDWEVHENPSLARRVGENGEAIFRNVQSRFYPKIHDAYAPKIFGSELAAVVAGRKPLYHDEYPDSAQSLAAGLRKVLPDTVVVDNFLTESKNAELFAAARAKDYTTFLKVPINVELTVIP